MVTFVVFVFDLVNFPHTHAQMHQVMNNHAVVIVENTKIGSLGVYISRCCLNFVEILQCISEIWHFMSNRQHAQEVSNQLLVSHIDL